MSTINLSDLISLHRLSLDADLRTAVLQECEALSAEECPNLWISAEEVPETPTFATQLLVNKMHQLVMSSRLSLGFLGVEIWVQKYEGGRGLAFHFDKDEHALRKTGDMAHPQFSSVVYLTGTQTQPRQAPTVVCAQQFDNSSKVTTPEDPCSSVIVFPRADNVLVFDGSLAHGVIQGPPAGTRMTLLINWWDQYPQDIPPLSRQLLQRLEVDMPEAAQLQRLEAAARTCTAEQLHPASMVLSRFLQEGSAELVSAACSHAGVQICGSDAAVDAVLVEHAGWDLVEVDVESWAEEACGAAWVPRGLVDGADHDAS